MKADSSETNATSFEAESVTVVIPTLGRPELARALKSVRDQSLASAIEIIVVADLDPAAEDAARVRDIVGSSQRVVFTGGGRGGSFARTLGISLGAGKWIALLDDDDYWLPFKLEDQLKLASSDGAHVISCRSIQVDADSGQLLVASVPARLYSQSESVAEYLFLKRPPHASRPSLFTSTLLIRSDLAKLVPWDESLARHQDWDWLLKLERQGDWRFAHSPYELVAISVGSSNSISRSANWTASLVWGERALSTESRSTQADFLVAHALRYALQARSPRGVIAALGAILRTRRVPHLGPALIGLSGAADRGFVKRAMSFTGGRK